MTESDKNVLDCLAYISNYCQSKGAFCADCILRNSDGYCAANLLMPFSYEFFIKEAKTKNEQS